MNLTSDPELNPCSDTSGAKSRELFENWTGNRLIGSIGTNAGAATLPFQSWKKFKEAFVPELILEAVDSSRIPVTAIYDPFGGSGTTALAAQFLGINPLTTEVNPYLADLIRAKLTAYNPSELNKEIHRIREEVAKELEPRKRVRPPTFIEPGVSGRFLYSRPLAQQIDRLLDAIERSECTNNARFFRIALSGVIVELSNARVAGKGRRYRSNWATRQSKPERVMELFDTHVNMMLKEVEAHTGRKRVEFEVIEGDSRNVDVASHRVELVVCSPPYPNSFDYTDVYNIELWMLGYLENWEENSILRESTLASHVQVSRDFLRAPDGSPMLDQTLRALRDVRDHLWDRRIPEMVGAYFADLVNVFARCAEMLTSGGQIWIVVGDSRYNGVTIRVADIIEELAPKMALSTVEKRHFRSMRLSPQQGGAEELAETLIVLTSPQ